MSLSVPVAARINSFFLIDGSVQFRARQTLCTRFLFTGLPSSLESITGICLVP